MSPACVQQNDFWEHWEVKWTAQLQNAITGAIIDAMNTATKLLHAMRQNPNDWAMVKLLTVAKQHGLEVRSTGAVITFFRIPR